MVLLSTHNICFGWEIRKLFFIYALLSGGLISDLKLWIDQESTLILIFQVQYILAELVMGGMVLETNMTEIITRIEEQNKMEKSEVNSNHSINIWGN